MDRRIANVNASDKRSSRGKVGLRGFEWLRNAGSRVGVARASRYSGRRASPQPRSFVGRFPVDAIPQVASRDDVSPPDLDHNAQITKAAVSRWNLSISGRVLGSARWR